MPEWILALGFQVTSWVLEVIVVGQVFARVDLFQHLPAVEVFLVHHRSSIDPIVLDGGFAGQRCMAADVVHQHQFVATLLVLKEEVNTLMLHQAHDKVQVSFLILNTVVPVPVGFLELVEQGKAILAQYIGNDVGDFLELENLAVAATTRQPQPGPQFGGVQQVLPLTPAAAKPGTDAAEKPGAFAILGFNLERDVLAKHGFGAQSGLFAVKHHIKLKQAGQRLRASHLAKPQRLTQRGGDVDNAFLTSRRHTRIPRLPLPLTHYPKSCLRSYVLDTPRTVWAKSYWSESHRSCGRHSQLRCTARRST